MAVAWVQLGCLAVRADSYENTSVTSARWFGMKIEEFTKATPGHTVTEWRSAGQFCIARYLPANSHRKSVCDDDGSDDCFEGATKFALQWVPAHVH
jgi:hypothetical protein